MKLAIADPPYPPFIGSGGRKNRASRWYGTGQRSRKDRPADQHPDAHQWDEPSRHRQLLDDLMASYDGWAISTSPDGIAAYGALPSAVRIMAWIKPNAIPGSHRLRSNWEPVILFPPAGRRSNRDGRGSIPDVHTAAIRTQGSFQGQKPVSYTHWILAALCYDPAEDSVDDLFSGSGAVSSAINSYVSASHLGGRAAGNSDLHETEGA